MGVGLGVGSYYAVEGLKDALYPNDVITEAVGQTTKKSLDLHDVMFHNATADGHDIDYSKLNDGIYAYVLVGTAMVTLALIFAMNYSGVNKTWSIIFGILPLVGGVLTAA